MKKIVEQLKSYLDSKGLDAYEIFCAKRGHFLADSKCGEVESLEEATEVGFAIRVIENSRLGFSYSTTLDLDSLKKSADWAVSGSRSATPDKAWEVAPSGSIAEFKWKCCDQDLADIPASKKIEMALAIEAAVLGVDSRLKRVRRAIYDESHITNYLANSEGVDLSFEKTLIGCDVMAIAESDGDAQASWDADFCHVFADADPEVVGKRAAEDAISLLGAKSIKTMKTPVCLHQFVAAQFLEIFCNGFFGDNIYKRKSPLIGKLGLPEYSAMLNVVDDGLLVGGYKSTPFDGEGTPHKKTYLVRDGNIESWLTDIYWGKKLGVPSTGSSLRKSVKELPKVGVSNAYIEPGNISKEALLGQIDKGLYITEVVGAHTTNPITGDFSVGAVGHWIEKGNISHPVKGVMISGNLYELFKEVSGVAADLRFMGKVGSPTILISSMQVSGS